MAIFFNRGAAARRVDHHGLDVGLFENVDHLPRQFLRTRFLSGMDTQGAAAGLLRGCDHLATFSSEHARGGGIYLREKSALHAPEQETHALAFFADGGRDVRDDFLWRYLRKQLVHRTDGFRQQAENAEGCNAACRPVF